MAEETIATGYIRLVPSVDGIQGALGNQFGGAGVTAGKRFGKGFLPSLKGLLIAGGGLLIAREVKQFVSQGIESLKRIEVINAQTGSVIKSTGGAANVSAGQIEKLAQSLEKTTATEAESIQQGANLLLTFKNIRNEAGAGNDIFNQTVVSMVDLGRAMGTDAKGGAIQLGKALNDPIKGIAALTRVGITFSEEQKAMIKSLVQSGDLLGAQKIILAELNSQFGGSGAAYAATYAGKVELVANAYGDIQENITSGVMPALGRFQDLALLVLNKVNESPALTAFIKKLNTMADGAVGGLEVAIAKVEELAASSEGITFEGLKNAFPALEPFLNLMQAVAPLLPALGDALVEIGPPLIEALPSLTTLIIELIPLLVTALRQLVDILPGLTGSVEGLIEPILQLSGLFLILSYNELIFDFFDDMSKTLDRVGKDFGDLTVDIGRFVIKSVGFLSKVADQVSGAFRGATRNVKSFLNDMIRSINEAIKGLNKFSSGVAGAIGLSGPQIPTIPLLADGGVATRAGWAWVGEAGPELINMRVGAEVRPLGNLGDAVDGAGRGGFVNNGTIVTADVKEFLREQQRLMRRAQVLEGLDRVV